MSTAQQPSNEGKEEYTIVMLGSGGVGKTNITTQIVKDKFTSTYDPTIEDSYDKLLSIDGTNTMLHLLDTAGQDEYKAMRDVYIRSGDAFVIVFALNEPTTYEECIDVYDQIARNKEHNTNIPIMLVGNKCDMEEERKVSKEDGEVLAKKFGNNCEYIEASAKTKHNVEEIFFRNVRKCRDLKNGIVGKEAEVKLETKVKKQGGFLFSSISGKQDAAKDLADFMGAK